MAKYDFSVHYDGPALENNSIPVQDLAPSLLSLSEAFQVIQRLNHPDQSPLSLNINATKEGSFVAELFLVNGQNLIKDAVNLLNGDASTAFINLTEYVEIFVGVVDVIKKVADHHIKAKEEKQGQVIITLDD